jgi:hydroxymethylglutaryl-CoA synthase
MTVSIVDYGCAYGRFALTTELLDAVGAKRPGGGWSWSGVPGPDEDALTLGLAAARTLGQDCSSVASLGLASTSLPWSRGVQSGLIVDAIGLGTDTLVTEHTTSARAATESLAGQISLVRGGGGGALVVAAETRSPVDRPATSAAAAAFLLGPEGEGPAAIEGIAHAVGEYPGIDFATASHRTRTDIEVPDYAAAAYTSLVSEATTRLLARLGLVIADFTAVILAGVDAGLAGKGARSIGAARQQWTDHLPFAFAGDTSAAAPLVGLAIALDKAEPGDRLLLIAYGGGSAVDAIVVRVDAELDAGVASARGRSQPLTVADYFRYLEGS